MIFADLFIIRYISYVLYSSLVFDLQVRKKQHPNPGALTNDTRDDNILYVVMLCQIVLHKHEPGGRLLALFEMINLQFWIRFLVATTGE